MPRIVLRATVALAAAGVAFVTLVVARVLVAGEVSCYEVCSPVTLWFDRAAPWPVVAAVVASAVAGWQVSRLVGS